MLISNRSDQPYNTQSQSLPVANGAEMAGIATKFVSLILISYFVYHIVRAVEKLYEHKIGTSVTRKNANTIIYPSLTLCPFNNQ